MVIASINHNLMETQNSNTSYTRSPYHKNPSKINFSSAGLNSPSPKSSQYASPIDLNYPKRPWEAQLNSSSERMNDSEISERIIKKAARKLKIFEDFGLHNNADTKYLMKGFDPKSSVQVKKTITYADLWGSKMTQSLLCSPRLRKAANILKHKYLIKSSASTNQLVNPDKPHIMDQHAQTRVFMQQNDTPKSSGFPAIKMATSKLTISNEVSKKKSKALKTIYSIMSSCDKLYQESKETEKELKKTSSREEFKHIKLRKKDIEQIQRFRNHMD